MITATSFQASSSNFYNAAGDQFNNATVTVIHPPQTVTEYVPPQRVNDAPIDLLTAHFTGRLKDLDLLFQGFFSPTTEHDLPTRCAVHGMPGVGKTKLMLQFCQIAFARLLYSHVFWASATTTDKLIEGMTKILDLVGHPDRTRSDQNAKVTAARLWLEDSERMDGIQWLFVLDNVDRRTLEFIRENLPRRNGKGNILFTTRTKDVAEALINVTGGPHFNLELRVPDLAETTLLLFSSAGIDTRNVMPSQKSQAEELVQAFGCLPLAVVHAASYMRQTALTLDDMLRISKSERKMDVIQWENDLTTYQQTSVISTFKTLLDQLEKDSPETFDLLAVLSFLDAENVPLGMLIDGAQASLPLLDESLLENPHHQSRMFARMKTWMHSRTLSKHRTTVHDPTTPTHPLPELHRIVSLILSPTSFPNALHKLQSLSFLERWSHEGKPSLRMHDQAWLQSSVTLVCSVWNEIDDRGLPKRWFQCEKFIPHIPSLSKAWTGVPGMNLVVVTANVYLALYLTSRRRYNDAESICERCVETFQEELGDEHRDTLWAIHTLACIYDDQGRWSDAEEAYKRVLVVDEKELGVEDNRTLAAMNNLAGIYRRQGRHEEAGKLFRRVLAVSEKKLGRDHPDTLMTMNNLALVYFSQERYHEAAELFNRVLSRKERTLGRDHIDTLLTANNLARVYQSQAKYRDAEELLKRALVDQQEQIDTNHDDTWETDADLGFLHLSQGQKDEADRILLRALKQTLGAGHPDTLSCAEKPSALHRSQRRNGDADLEHGQ